MRNLRFPSRCGRYWLELFWRRDANSNASARAAMEWIVEKLGGEVTWGPRPEGQQ